MAPRGKDHAGATARHDQILRLAEAHDASNVHDFGSIARGTADASSDVDFFVDVVTDATGFAYFGLLGHLRRALTSTFHCDVDVVHSAGLDSLRKPILHGAVPL